MFSSFMYKVSSRKLCCECTVIYLYKVTVHCFVGSRIFCDGTWIYLLVVQYYIWKPDILWWYMKMFNSTIICWIPWELVIPPLLNQKKIILNVLEGSGPRTVFNIKCWMMAFFIHNPLFLWPSKNILIYIDDVHWNIPL